MEKINVNTETQKPFRVVITGPESSGKTVLAEKLALYYESSLIPEYSRIFSEKTKGAYTQKDLLTIANGQYELQKSAEKKGKSIIISDTGLLVMKIWSVFKYGTVDPWIENKLSDYADLYLLCRPDIEWTFDPLRENPFDRDHLFEIYENELESMNVNYALIQGENRLRKAILVIESFIY